MRSAVPYDSGVFPPPQANCRSRRCCNASPLSSTYVAYVSHVHFWHGREQRWRHVRVFPYTWVEKGGHDIARRLRASLCLSLFFWKERERERERRRPLGQISAWFTTIPGQGTFFIPHILCLVRVTIAPCLEVLCTKCHYFSSTTSSRYVISCCIVSVELNNSRYFERGGEEERDSFFDPRLFEKEEFFFYGRVIVDGCILFWRMGDIISWGSNEDSSFGVEKVFNFWECSIYMYSETYFNIFFFFRIL